MNKALVLLTLALAIGIVAAPAASASCPPSGRIHCPGPTPAGAFVGCLVDAGGEYVAEAAADCL